VGSFFQKKKQYRSKPLKEIEQTNMNLYETMCYIKKSYLQHWICKGVKMEFKIPKINKWDSHPLNIQLENAANIGNNYSTLAESDRGPQLIEHGNMIASQFHIDPVYPETLQILKNFVDSKLGLLQCNQCLGGTIDAAFVKEKRISSTVDDKGYLGKKQILIPQSSKIRPSTTNENIPHKFTTLFVHSGKNYSKRREEVVVTNNAFGSYVNSKMFSIKLQEQLKPIKTYAMIDRAKSVPKLEFTSESILRNKLEKTCNLQSQESIYFSSSISNFIT